MTLETLITFLTIENNNINNYIVTFEYRVMVTAFAILDGGSKYRGSRPIVAKIADLGPPGAPQYFFQKKTQNVRITVHLDICVCLYLRNLGARLVLYWSLSKGTWVTRSGGAGLGVV